MQKLSSILIQRTNQKSSPLALPQIQHELFFKPAVQPKMTSNQPAEISMRMTDNINMQQLFFEPPDSSIRSVDKGQQEKQQHKKEGMHLFDGQTDCSPTWFGDTSPEIDQQTGGFTGKLIVTYNNNALKDPCVRECVELHESVHVEDLLPIVNKIHDCDVAAGTDWNKKEKCNDMSNKELSSINKKSECRAYIKSYTCLTLKILDSSSKCSKSPHREEIQKHRSFEGCEMKKACAAAGTPAAGIPNA